MIKERESMAQEAYITYASGISILNRPDSHISQLIHRQDINFHNMENVVVHAEKLVISGLQNFLVNTNSLLEDSKLSSSQHDYVNDMPNIIKNIDNVFDIHERRLCALNPALIILRPFPLYDPIHYDKFVNMRWSEISLHSLMGGLNMSRSILSRFIDRKVFNS